MKRVPIVLAAMVVAASACVGPRPATMPVPVPAVQGSNNPATDSGFDRVSGNAGSNHPPGWDPAKHGGRRFYTGKSYGTESEFNPLTEFLNEGFDVLSSRGQNRRVFDRP